MYFNRKPWWLLVVRCVFFSDHVALAHSDSDTISLMPRLKTLAYFIALGAAGWVVCTMKFDECTAMLESAEAKLPGGGREDDRGDKGAFQSPLSSLIGSQESRAPEQHPTALNSILKTVDLNCFSSEFNVWTNSGSNPVR